MSGVRQLQSTPRRAKKADRRSKRAVRSSCDAAPEQPQNAFTTYDQLGRHRTHRFRAILGCDAVTTDTDGYPINPTGYHWQFREVDSSGADQWNGHWPKGTIRVRAGDDPLLASEHVRHHQLHHGHWYQCRWACFNPNGDGEWSAWSPKTQFLEGASPLAPTIAGFDVDQHKMAVGWTNPADPTNPLIHHKDTLENLIQIATGPAFSTIVRSAHVKAGPDGHHVFKFPKPGTQTYYCRVGAKTQGGLIEWSATASGNRVDPPAPASVAAGDAHFKHGGKHNTTVRVDYNYSGTYADDDVVEFGLEWQHEPHALTGSDDWHGPLRHHFKPGDSVTGHFVIHKLRPKWNLRFRTFVKDSKGHRSDYSAVGP